jgi:membrane associated rhomboid family serine protease
MVLPLFDDNSDRERPPIVTYLLIIANVLIFIFLQGMGDEDNHFTRTFSLVPEEIITGQNLDLPRRPAHNPVTGEEYELPAVEPTPVSVYLTLLTSIFMHAGWLHLLGNMLFLWVFGDNVEDRLGYVRYLIFYLLCGVLAALAHVATVAALDQNRTVPCVGASGAISGVLGGYVLLFPSKRVTVLLFRVVTEVPAFLVIGLWFAFQLVHGLGVMGDGGGGVAYGAHVGGFIAGLALVKVFTIGLEEPRSKAPRWSPPRRPGARK